jgi:hypothetical protein
MARMQGRRYQLLPLFGRRRLEVSPEDEESARHELLTRLAPVAEEVASLTEGGLAEDLAREVLEMVGDHAVGEVKVKVYNRLLQAFADRASGVAGQLAEAAAAGSPEAGALMRAASLYLGSKALHHFCAKMVSDLLDGYAREWALEARIGLLEARVKQVEEEMIKEWESELARRRAERAERRRREEEEEWERIRSMDPTQRAAEIFEIAEALKSMKTKPWMAPALEEREAAAKRRQEEEARAQAQDEEEDRRFRSEVGAKAAQRVNEEVGQEWAARLRERVPLACRRWVAENAAGPDTELVEGCLRLAKEAILAAEADGELERLPELLEGLELGKNTREVVDRLASFVTRFSWT